MDDLNRVAWTLGFAKAQDGGLIGQAGKFIELALEPTSSRLPASQATMFLAGPVVSNDWLLHSE